MSHSTAAGRRAARPLVGEAVLSAGISVLRLVAEVGGEPLLGFAEAPPLAGGVVGDLVLAEAAHDEVPGLRVGQVPAAHRGAGPHRHALGESYADGPLD